MIKKNIPNLFTVGNLFSGCIAVVFAFEGNLIGAAYLVGIACVFDFLDGLVARILKVSSEIGKQLDSLADVVSFGVVPGVIIFKLINQTMITSPISFLGFLVTIFSAIRLAKFNIDTRQTDSFIGLPVPANASFIASLPLILNSDSFNGILQQTILNPYCLILLSLISSFLLVAPLPLFALKFKNFSWAGNKIRYIFLLLSPVLLIVFKLAGIPLIIILYIVLSIINNLFSKPKNVFPTNYK